MFIVESEEFSGLNERTPVSKVGNRLLTFLIPDLPR